MSLARAALSLGALLGLASCAVEPGTCQVSAARAALTNGSERASYLKLAVAEEEAIVEVVIRAEHVAIDEHCSGVLIAPGNVFSASGTASTTFRLCLGRQWNTRVEQAIARVGALCHRLGERQQAR